MLISRPDLPGFEGAYGICRQGIDPLRVTGCGIGIGPGWGSGSGSGAGPGAGSGRGAGGGSGNGSGPGSMPGIELKRMSGLAGEITSPWEG